MKWKRASAILIGFAAAAGLAACKRESVVPVPPGDLATREAQVRHALLDALQPVALSNCEMARVGEPHDGGYLFCGNLLGEVKSAYSYGIDGYDDWGCEISGTLGIPVHRYDCFNTTNPDCPGGSPVFHAECLGSGPVTDEGRRFDSLASQIARNGDAGRRLVVKMDVERAEWDALLGAPDEVLEQIDQLAVEFHDVDEERFVLALWRLGRFFHVANLHFNNYTCKPGIEPFPARAYEVLFVNRRLPGVAPLGPAPTPHPLDAPNDPSRPDCQAVTSTTGRPGAP